MKSGTIQSNTNLLKTTLEMINNTNNDYKDNIKNHVINTNHGKTFNPLVQDSNLFCKRIIIASNSLPVNVQREKEEDSDQFKINVTREPFPIESALFNLLGKEIEDYLWVGWPHCNLNEEDDLDVVRDAINKEEPHFYPIFLDNKSITNYYKGFCKIGLWQLLHYQMNHVRLDMEWWDSYVQVNQLFADHIGKLWRPGDFVWVHDYHLMLLPVLLREKYPSIPIGFFFHAPFPSYELFRILPSRKELLNGILGSNLIGFQSFEYLRHFRSSCARLLDLEAEPKGIEVVTDHQFHFVKLQVYPVGVDFSDFVKSLGTASVIARVEKLKTIFEGKKVVFARDRLDSIEGVPRKLQVIEGLLKNYPEWRGKLVFIQIYEPTTELCNESEEQKKLHRTVNETVGRINGEYGTLDFNPIEYINRVVSFEEISALYKLADVALVTPVRDGMNLTSHEYVVCQKDSHGVLILSEFTGAARCLGGAIIVNPFSKKEMTDAILEALQMTSKDRKLKHQINYNYVMANTSEFWAKRFLYDLHEVVREDIENSSVPHLNIPAIKKSFAEARGKHPRNEIYIISGRDRASLEGWLGKLPVGMSCEHGGLFRPTGIDQQWIENSKIDLSWKETVVNIMQDFEDRTPGSFVEHKQINLTWHYRNADPDFSEFQAKELMAQLHAVANKYPLDILVGKKAIEVKPIGINKGGIIKLILSKSDHEKPDFILCIGDDKTDEDMFKELTSVDAGYTVKVLSDGAKDQMNTYAKSYIENSNEVIQLLNELSKM
ncbi:glycosyltransferase [Heterostelium album PN500]|uniref:Glycosyltransferase n=1 Tax=Heterostelium pallidum (strain ATCC 26659 / Pp 5 / PN500) TaxID=670386 RepID=D3BPP7_HETP5|nr:glycosyltransferase [Heterostelium album PN500]EFA76609.1 glycosyltransferase [Heterostelium album PN500]|eukprot:XP_020428741.1 glycosyltransferase [Heterostelium album PN500]